MGTRGGLAASAGSVITEAMGRFGYTKKHYKGQTSLTHVYNHVLVEA